MSLKQRLGLTEEPIFLMDGSAFIYRGFYANRSMQRSDGYPTNALFVVSRILLRILREEQPRHFAFVLDGKGKNFRHKLFPLYKANRDATPEDLIRQIEPIERLVRTLGLCLEVSEGCEADDCIASLTARFSKERPVIITGADKDLRQCLAPGIYLWDPAAREEKLLSAEDFTTETGLAPAQWPDVQAVTGDASDNIPGIPGIGPKTAAKIFSQFPTLEAIRDGVDDLPPKLRDKVAPHLDAMFLYRQLTTLHTDCCAHLTLDDLAVRPMNVEGAAAFISEFELFSLRRELDAMAKEGRLAFGSAGGAADDRQLSLFDAAPAAAPLPHVTDPADLPPCDDLPAAVVPLNGARGGGLVVAAAGRECRYTGPLPALIRHLSRAAQLAAPDVKALLTADPSWEEIPPQIWFDLGIAAYLINPEERDYGWPKLAARWTEPLRISDSNPGLLALGMAATLAARLASAQLDALYQDLEMPLVPVLARMERQGVAIDDTAFAAFLHDVQSELDRLTEEVYKAAGGPFNIRSAQQLGEVLFTTLKLPTAGKTRGGQFSTSQDSLEKLAGRHPVVDAILEFRKLEKLRSTYLEPLPRLVDGSGRIHTTFNQTATATGRLSSSNPNLQNIPVRGPLGQRMRACFIARPGHVLVSADYSQVELRVLAHVSQDPTLLDAFRHGRDIHTSTAALIFDTPPDKVTPDQRRNAKTINFGLIYGMGAQKLAQELKITANEAKTFITHYFEHLSKLKEYYDGVENSAKELGYVTTLAGRRRILSDIHSQNAQAFALARRQAINTVIQGSAADIIKLAMLAVQADASLNEMRARLVLQVHDELLLEVPEAHGSIVGERVAACMEAVAPGGVHLDVPLLVDWGMGRDWGSAH